MRNRRNYYRILHVQRDAPLAVLKSSYRALMLNLEMHPDRGGEHWNAAVLNEAYAVLSNPERRAEYDRTVEATLPREDRKETSHGNEIVLAVEFKTFCLFCGSQQKSDEKACLVCGSPRTPPETLQLQSSGRRATWRVDRDGVIHYYAEWPSEGNKGRIIDMSLSGLRFEGTAPLALFQIVKIEGPLVDAIGRVVSRNASPGGCTFGIEFYTVQFRQARGTFLSSKA